MKDIPAIWRTELWHPLSVHFPIAFLISGTFIGCLIFLFSKKYRVAAHLKFTMSLLLWSGTVLLWLSFYTGKLAYSIEVRRICDPFVLKDHLYWANVACFVFSFATVSDLFQTVGPLRIKRWLMPVTIVLMITGSVFLAYTGHLGASLVYQQGAGVHKPAADCSDYK